MTVPLARRGLRDRASRAGTPYLDVPIATYHTTSKGEITN
jgi:hypothetical protein